MKFLTILLSLSLSSVFASNNLSHITSILKQVESLGDTKAVGDGGKAYGVLQIHKAYVNEVNNRYGTTYTHEEMFDEICAEEVFYLYMRYASKRFKKLYKRSPTEEEIVRMHNGGMYQGHKIKATVKYYKKYLKFEKVMVLKDSEWIEGYRGHYSIDTEGVVYNHKKQKVRIQKHGLDKDGYSLVTLSILGKKRTFRVHRLVAQTYLPNPLKKATVNHLDFNKGNNSLANLEWATRSENTKHGYINGVIKVPRIDVKGKNNPFYGKRHTKESKDKMSKTRLKRSLI